MGLLFYKKFTIQTKHTPAVIGRIISDTINKPRRNEEVERLLRNNNYVRLNFTGDRFRIALGQIARRWQRSGIHSVLKGKMTENPNKQGTTIVMSVRPSDEYVILLGLAFLFIIGFLFFSIINHDTPPIIISSIMLFAWYTGFLILFNSQVRSFKRIIDDCFL